MSDWEWFHEVRQKAYQAKDTQRIRLIDLYYEGQGFSEKEPDRAIAIYEQAHALAEQLGEGWVMLAIDERHLRTLMYEKANYLGALDLAVRATVELRKPVYRRYPRRFMIPIYLVQIYRALDARQYASDLKALLDYLIVEVPEDDKETQYELHSKRILFAMTMEEWDNALELGLRYLALCGEDMAEAVRVYVLLCRVASNRREWKSVEEWAQAGAEGARQVNRMDILCECQAWLAFLARRDNNEADAKRYYEEAIATAKSVGERPIFFYYNILASFHVNGEEWEKASLVRQHQIEHVGGTGQVMDELYYRVEHIKALGKLGQPIAEEHRAARDLLGQVSNPAPYDTELADLEKQYLSPPSPPLPPAAQAVSDGLEQVKKQVVRWIAGLFKG
ncbi:MAG: hypothetical protein H0T73_08265 [Ardenticatenales bacterium]|nr:hypothetical protein [Ardenticatenales bacterium]